MQNPYQPPTKEDPGRVRSGAGDNVSRHQRLIKVGITVFIVVPLLMVFISMFVIPGLFIWF